MALVDGADFAPSEESFAAYQRTCKALNATLGMWQETKAKDAAALHAILAQSNAASVPDYPSESPIDDCGN